VGYEAFIDAFEDEKPPDLLQLHRIESRQQFYYYAARMECLLNYKQFKQWRTHEFCSGGSKNSGEDRGRESGNLGPLTPIVTGSAQFANE
jgi:hypothetical protein